jgi:Na+/H+-dicarboxylate symporter
MKWWFRRPLYTQIFVCILAGALLGLALGDKASALKPVGDVFLRLLMMLIVPLTFFTLTSGMTKLEDLRSFRKMGGMVVLYFLLTSLLAAAVGTASGLLVRPGKEAAGLLDQGAKVEAVPFDFLENVVSWFPKNPVESFSQGNMLQIIVFSLIVGLGLLALGDKGARLVRLVDDGAELMIKITDFVMKVAPYGILALVADMVASLGTRMLGELARLVAADVAAMAFLLAAVYPAALRLLGRLGPLRFYRNAASAMLVAASTTSSGATLPVSMAAARDHMGIPEKIWGFSLPLGATVNMDGMAASIGVIAVFAANLYGIPITASLLVQFVFLGLVLSIGTAGIKGGGIVMSGVLLQSLNMPLALIPILASIWPVLDIGHTTCNVTGDLAGTAIVANRMKALDRDVFDGTRADGGAA